MRKSLFLFCVVYLFQTSWADEPFCPYPSGQNGDIWLLAGQSNCVGIAPMKQKIPPDPRILFFIHKASSCQWVTAEEPLGLLPRIPERLPAEATVGWNLMFAKALIQYTNRPIGLIRLGTGKSIPVAWDPELNNSEGRSSKQRFYVYDALIRRVISGGGYGKLKGMIWYQGESDAVEYPSASKDYKQNLIRFIRGIRQDTGNFDLPIVVVQLSRLIGGGVPGQSGQSDGGEVMQDMFRTYTLAWERVREAQRDVANEMENVYLVSTVDLYQMTDPIHLDFEAHERLAKRLAEVAASQVYKLPGYAGPIRLESITIEPTVHEVTGVAVPDRSTIRVKFNGVNGRLKSFGPPSGFSLRSGLEEDKRSIAHVFNLEMRIYKIDFDPKDHATVLLRICGQPDMFNSQYHASLFYGAGLSPFCTIMDENDVSLPAFGPVEVPNPLN